MSTRRAPASSVNKEKRGTSPANTIRKITTPNHPSTKTSSPAKNHGPTSSSSGKNIPSSYLKAVTGSNLDKQQGEKSADASSNRRISLDHKPQSFSLTQRTRAPPRSSSFSGKTTVANSHKKTGGAADHKGLIRGTRDGAGKQQEHGLYARSSVGSSSNARKSTTTTRVYVKKQVSASSSTESLTKKEEVVMSPVEKVEDHTEQVLSDEAEADHEVERDQVHESLTAEKVEDGNELESEHDHQTEVAAESDDAKDAKIEDTESSAAVVEHDNECVAVKNEEKPCVEESITNNHEETIHEVVNNNDDNISDDHIVAEDNNPIENFVQVKNEKGEEEEKEADRETVVREVVTEKKRETINLTAKYPGKKENAVSNDVIEETASKLREQRKNKVKALAGAFETVISLQESK